MLELGGAQGAENEVLVRGVSYTWGWAREFCQQRSWWCTVRIWSHRVTRTKKIQRAVTCDGNQLNRSKPSVVVASGSIKYALNKWPSRTAGSEPAGPAICAASGWTQRSADTALQNPKGWWHAATSACSTHFFAAHPVPRLAVAPQSRQMIAV
jgi:hypothetical protein